MAQYAMNPSDFMNSDYQNFRSTSSSLNYMNQLAQDDYLAEVKQKLAQETYELRAAAKYAEEEARHIAENTFRKSLATTSDEYIREAKNSFDNGKIVSGIMVGAVALTVGYVASSTLQSLSLANLGDELSKVSSDLNDSMNSNSIDRAHENTKSLSEYVEMCKIEQERHDKELSILKQNYNTEINDYYTNKSQITAEYKNELSKYNSALNSLKSQETNVTDTYNLKEQTSRDTMEAASQLAMQERDSAVENARKIYESEVATIESNKDNMSSEAYDKALQSANDKFSKSETQANNDFNSKCEEATNKYNSEVASHKAERDSAMESINSSRKSLEAQKDAAKATHDFKQSALADDKKKIDAEYHNALSESRKNKASDKRTIDEMTTHIGSSNYTKGAIAGPVLANDKDVKRLSTHDKTEKNILTTLNERQKEIAIGKILVFGSDAEADLVQRIREDKAQEKIDKALGIPHASTVTEAEKTEYERLCRELGYNDKITGKELKDTIKNLNDTIKRVEKQLKDIDVELAAAKAAIANFQANINKINKEISESIDAEAMLKSGKSKDGKSLTNDEKEALKKKVLPTAEIDAKKAELEKNKKDLESSQKKKAKLEQKKQTAEDLLKDSSSQLRLLNRFKLTLMNPQLGKRIGASSGKMMKNSISKGMKKINANALKGNEIHSSIKKDSMALCKAANYIDASKKAGKVALMLAFAPGKFIFKHSKQGKKILKIYGETKFAKLLKKRREFLTNNKFGRFLDKTGRKVRNSLKITSLMRLPSKLADMPREMALSMGLGIVKIGVRVGGKITTRAASSGIRFAKKGTSFVLKNTVGKATSKIASKIAKTKFGKFLNKVGKFTGGIKDTIRGAFFEILGGFKSVFNFLINPLVLIKKFIKWLAGIVAHGASALVSGVCSVIMSILPFFFILFAAIAAAGLLMSVVEALKNWFISQTSISKEYVANSPAYIINMGVNYRQRELDIINFFSRKVYNADGNEPQKNIISNILYDNKFYLFGWGAPSTLMSDLASTTNNKAITQFENYCTGYSNSSTSNLTITPEDGNLNCDISVNQYRRATLEYKLLGQKQYPTDLAGNPIYQNGPVVMEEKTSDYEVSNAKDAIALADVLFQEKYPYMQKLEVAAYLGVGDFHVVSNEASDEAQQADKNLFSISHNYNEEINYIVTYEIKGAIRGDATPSAALEHNINNQSYESICDNYGCEAIHVKGTKQVPYTYAVHDQGLGTSFTVTEFYKDGRWFKTSFSTGEDDRPYMDDCESDGCYDVNETSDSETVDICYKHFQANGAPTRNCQHTIIVTTYKRNNTECPPIDDVMTVDVDRTEYFYYCKGHADLNIVIKTATYNSKPDIFQTIRGYDEDNWADAGLPRVEPSQSGFLFSKNTDDEWGFGTIIYHGYYPELDWSKDYNVNLAIAKINNDSDYEITSNQDITEHAMQIDLETAGFSGTFPAFRKSTDGNLAFLYAVHRGSASEGSPPFYVKSYKSGEQKNLILADPQGNSQYLSVKILHSDDAKTYVTAIPQTSVE